MREHGVLRRAILVFRESAVRLAAGQAVDAGALHKTAQFFREFGEDYHEKKLEEENIFPTSCKAGGEAGAMRFFEVRNRRVSAESSGLVIWARMMRGA